MGNMYRRARQSGCRITDDLVYKGYRSLLLENESLLIHLLLDKGSEPIRWLHKPTDTDFIWQTRMGLLPAHGLYPDYEMSYLGGWQEMFPEVSRTHTYRGATLHRGESSVTPWDYHIEKDEPAEIRVRLVNRIRSLPVVLEKTITLKMNSACVIIEEQITNESGTAIEASWGHHLAYGPPFLDRETRVELGAGSVVRHPQSGESWPWPQAMQMGEAVDLSRMADPGTMRDLLYVMPERGEYKLIRPKDGLALQVRWDQSVWRYLWYWQNYAADAEAPFYACEYNIGLEMFNVPPKLTVEEAVKMGLSITVPSGGCSRSWLEIEIQAGGEQHGVSGNR